MKIIKPLTLGLLHKPYTQAGQHHLVVSALGFFTLGQGVPARLLGEAAQWPRVMSALPPAQPLDEVMPKACAEAMVFGAACAPQGKATTSLTVRLQVGSIDKQLMVHGPRGWQRDAAGQIVIDEPAPFLRVPLDHAHAWGGAGFDDNPVGVGAETASSAGKGGPLPQLEYANARLTDPAQAVPVASLAPRAIDWAPRRRHAGTYDAAWLRDHYPGLPTDLDWRLYNQAAEDQRLEGFFAGGEPYTLHGMHAEHPRLSGQLPGHRARAFVLAEGEQAGALREVAMRMDTVWFIPDQQLGVVAWRGTIEIADSDALDVQALMLAYEAEHEPARSQSHYADVLRLRLDEQAGPAHAFNEAQLAPARAAADLSRDAEQSAAEIAQSQQRRAGIDAAMRDEFAARSGRRLPTAAASIKTAQLLAPPSAQAIAAGDFDLTALLAQADAAVQQARSDGEAARTELQRKHPAAAAAGPPTAAPDHAQVHAQVMQRASLPHPAPASAAGHMASARRASPVPVAPAAALPPELAHALGQQALQWVAAGQTLAGRDLAGADLHGAALAGQDLRHCLLEFADLRGADLRGCRLDGAVLVQAQLDGADLSGARLTDANLCAAQAPGARFEGAVWLRTRASKACFAGAQGRGVDLTSAMLDDADFENADFSNARLDATLLNQAKLRGSRWQGASFSRCVGWKLQGQQADFSASQWTRSALIGADLSGSRWHDARLSQLQGGSATWVNADMRSARAERCGWPAADLSGADLRSALFASCDFSRAVLTGARLEGGCFPRSLFMQTQMTGLLAADADFFQALMRKADLRGADLRRANLVQTEMTQARLDGACLDGLWRDSRSVLA